MNNGEHSGRDGAPVGAILERARRERGLSLRDVEHATKIRTRYLDGLEREDFSVLPDTVYVQGFLKTYANFLGLDGEEMARELKTRRSPRRERQQQVSYGRPQDSEFERPIISPGGLAGTERRGISAATLLAVALAVLALAGVIGVLYYIGVQSAGGATSDKGIGAPAKEPGPGRPAQGGSTSSPPPAERAKQQRHQQAPAAEAPPPKAPPPKAPPPKAPPPKAPPAGTLSVTVSVLGSPAGLTISADGEVVSDVFAQPGFSQTYKAQRVVTVSTANAGAVDVEANGHDLGRLGYYGQPVTRDFTSSDS
jgi:cytoskeletal protein RodZ